MPGPAIKVTVLYGSNCPHLQQLFTGLSLLHKIRQIDCRYRRAPLPNNPHWPRHLQGSSALRCVLLVNGKQVAVDVHDSREVDEELLARCDLYFKRSYQPAYLASQPNGQKARPLGLNYEVFSGRFDAQGIRRVLSLGDQFSLRGISQLIRYCGQPLDNWIGFSPSLAQLTSPPTYAGGRPTVIFFCNVHAPTPEMSAEKQEHRLYLAHSRARLVRNLRKALGERFVGGLMHTEFARREYPDCLADSPRATQRSRYIRTLRQADIGIATTGLHDSIGWKFAEYLAHSKAVVSEALHYFPGSHLKEGTHYLAATEDELTETVLGLCESPKKIMRMQANNFNYYGAHLAPHTIALNVIESALDQSS